jgi:hypothetical protein
MVDVQLGGKQKTDAVVNRNISFVMLASWGSASLRKTYNVFSTEYREMYSNRFVSIHFTSQHRHQLAYFKL